MTSTFENYEFANWQPVFKGLSPRARILDAPEEFREYLLSDGIALYEEDEHSDSDSEWESEVPAKDKTSKSADDTHHKKIAPPADFHHLIERTIAELNGEVAPKLNWSAPVDAKWINPGNTMRCTSANEVYTLLKSSDYINHDLELNPKKVTLVLREWFDVHPSAEFRCFVRDGKLVGITQRDVNYYEFLEASKPVISTLCRDMASNINEKFPDKSYVFDVYIPDPCTKAWLIDINPWHEQTDSILFSWDELPNLKDLEIRLIEKVDRSRTFSSKPHSTSHVPLDFVNMGKEELADMLSQMKEQRKTEENERVSEGASEGASASQ